jgi:hypothetical protein
VASSLQRRSPNFMPTIMAACIIKSGRVVTSNMGVGDYRRRLVDPHLCTKAPQTPQTRSQDCPSSLTASSGMLTVKVMVKL